MLEMLAFLANYTPVVSLITSAVQESAGVTQSMGGWSYDIIAFLTGMVALGRFGAWLAAKTETTVDDRFWAKWAKVFGWLLGKVTELAGKTVLPVASGNTLDRSGRRG